MIQAEMGAREGRGIVRVCAHARARACVCVCLCVVVGRRGHKSSGQPTWSDQIIMPSPPCDLTYCVRSWASGTVITCPPQASGGTSTPIRICMVDTQVFVRVSVRMWLTSRQEARMPKGAHKYTPIPIPGLTHHHAPPLLPPGP